MDILEGCFGQQDPDSSQSTISLEEVETDIMVEDVTSNIPEKTLPPVSISGGLASAELVFPLKSVPTDIAGIPEPFLPVHGLETLSLYHCQFPSCTLVITFIMIISILHWHIFIVALSTIPNCIGIVPLLGSTILPPIPKKTFPFIQMILPFPNNLLVVLEMELYHLLLDLYQISLMLLSSISKQKLLNIS